MFYDVFARYYDRFMQSADYQRLCDYITKQLMQNGVENGIAVDLGCGTGTLALLLAKRGYELIGVDISAPMLGEARRKADEQGIDILLLNQDICSIDLYGTVKCCICTLDTVNHLEDRDSVRSLFERASLFTEPGGIFIFDINTEYKHREILADNAFVFEDEEGNMCVWRNSVNDDDSVDIAIDLFVSEPDGTYRRFCEDFTENIYDETFIMSLLKDNSFELIERADGESFDCPDAQAQRIIYTAKKV